MLSTSHLAEEKAVAEIRAEAEGELARVLIGTAHITSLRKRPAETSTAAKTARAEFGEEWIKILPIPILIDDYNQRMNGVNRGDGLRTWADGPRRIRKGSWKALWHFLWNVAVTNSFILSGQKDHSKWITSLIKVLLEKGDSCITAILAKKRKRDPISKEANPISDGQHHGMVSQKRGECVVCRRKGSARAPKRKALGELSTNIQGQTKRPPSSSYGCGICKVSLCKEGPCFVEFHSID
jgi:hypothetical protein